MNTEKKNQHYIPKFYLRNFSFNNNQNQIGIFNLKNDFFYSTSKLKTQGSKNFFYGYDGLIEDTLSKMEGDISSTIKNILDNKTLPKKNSKEHVDLLVFVALTDLRNPMKIGNMKDMLSGMKEKLLEVEPNAEIENLIPTFSHEEFIEMSISSIPEMTFNIMDLEYKLLINETEYPFISSDNPVVRYNQYLEKKRWPHGKCGYGVIGLQIFMPLNPNISIHFYDSAIYKVGNKKQKALIIKNNKDIDSINYLQFVNCIETIYFNEKGSETYIRKLRTSSMKYQKANKSRAELSYIVDKDNEKEIMNSGKKNLIITGTSDCETNLNIEGIKIHSKGKSHKLTTKVTQLRKHPNTYMDIVRNR